MLLLHPFVVIVGIVYGDSINKPTHGDTTHIAPQVDVPTPTNHNSSTLYQIKRFDASLLEISGFHQALITCFEISKSNRYLRLFITESVCYMQAFRSTPPQGTHPLFAQADYASLKSSQNPAFLSRAWVWGNAFRRVLIL